MIVDRAAHVQHSPPQADYLFLDDLAAETGQTVTDLQRAYWWAVELTGIDGRPCFSVSELDEVAP